MKNWFSKNGLQLVVLILSFAMAAAIKFDYAHVDTYLAIATMCGLLGIKLMPLVLPGGESAPAAATVDSSEKKDDKNLPPPPGALAFAFAVVLGVLGFATLQACTPAEWQATSKTFVDAATCIEAQARPGSDPKAIALSCGLDAVPDVMGVISSVIMSKTVAASDAKKLGNCTVIVVDAGAPDGAGK